MAHAKANGPQLTGLLQQVGWNGHKGAKSESPGGPPPGGPPPGDPTPGDPPPGDTLFGPPGDSNGISYQDIHQGGLGDCYFLAALGEVAKNDPDFIRQMIRDNGNGTYTVTLYQFEPVQVTVSPSDFAPNGVNSQPDEGVIDGQKELWPQIIEAAYAKLEGGYGKIGNGGYPSDAMETLTGFNASWSSPGSFEQIKSDLAKGKLVTLDTPDEPLPYDLLSSHSYMVIGTYTDLQGNNYVKLQNPWGYDQPSVIPAFALSKVFNVQDVGMA
jgi:hypothetical protein